MLNRSRIDVSRVLGDIDTLSKFGWDSEFGGVTRPSYSPAYEDAARWVAERMRDAGMEVKRDAVGNLIGRLGPDTGPAVIWAPLIIVIFGIFLDLNH